ncbi:nucleolar protein 58 [Euwallacea similis]|uniref:nucleolar protein 58 n=1 Tax=Euwallacea similis TaxID=1736056 RepID=UPI00344FDAB3
MLVLFETAAGYAIFKLLDERKLEQIDNLYESFQTPEAASQVLKLKHFERFTDVAQALKATTAAVDGKLSKCLKKVIKNHVVSDMHEQLLVADNKLGLAIKNKFSLRCLCNTAVQELMRCIRGQLEVLTGTTKKDQTSMALGLAHSLSRYKLKFSPDKVDTMIVQAVSLLDDLDKELNNYSMRCREWYGWHFPEMSKIVADNMAYAKTVRIIGTREKAVDADLSEVLPENVENELKVAAEVSMGTEISDDDLKHIRSLCEQIIEMTDYRQNLYEYLKNRMMAIAPNLTVLVGELVGARLISHAGSLINLAKHPASTVQLLGAEKALFRALKSKKETPKYGLIYHAQLIGKCSTKNKGKMSRMLAAKAALATRVDALGEEVAINLGPEHKAKLEARLIILEEGNVRRISGTGKAKAKFEKYHTVSEIKQYPVAADSTLPSTSKRKRSVSEVKQEDLGEGTSASTEVLEKKKNKKDKQEPQQVTEVKVESPKKKKKKVKQESVEEEEVQQKEEILHTKKKKKDKVKLETLEPSIEVTEEVQEPSVQKKKKKKDKGKLEATPSTIEVAEEVQEPPVEKKKKKKHKLEVEIAEEVPKSVEKKKEKKKTKVELEVAVEGTEVGPSEKKKKKKKHTPE